MLLFSEVLVIFGLPTETILLAWTFGDGSGDAVLFLCTGLSARAGFERDCSLFCALLLLLMVRPFSLGALLCDFRVLSWSFNLQLDWGCSFRPGLLGS